jgi:hypothetical protein
MPNSPATCFGTTLAKVGTEELLPTHHRTQPSHQFFRRRTLGDVAASATSQRLGHIRFAVVHAQHDDTRANGHAAQVFYQRQTAAIGQ